MEAEHREVVATPVQTEASDRPPWIILHTVEEEPEYRVMSSIVPYENTAPQVWDHYIQGGAPENQSVVQVQLMPSGKILWTDEGRIDEVSKKQKEAKDKRVMLWIMQQRMEGKLPGDPNEIAPYTGALEQ
jgi:hypothetical protein